MLFAANQIIKARRFFDQPLRGVVVSNQDPRGLSRVKCRIPPFIDGDVADLPWVYAQMPAAQGGNPATSGFGVPIIGSELIIEFPTKDPHFPVYVGFWKSAGTQQAAVSAEDYPNTYGQIDDTGNSWVVNKAKGTMTWTHHSGSTLHYTPEGDVIMTAARDVVENVGRNYTKNVAGDYAVVVKGDKSEQVQGNRNSNVVGTETRKAAIIMDNP